MGDYLDKMVAERRQRLARMQTPQGSSPASPVPVAPAPEEFPAADEKIAAFASRIEALEQQVAALMGRRPAKTSANRARISDIKAAVARHYGVTTADLENPWVRGPQALPRQVAIYLARQLTGNRNGPIARAFQLASHTGVHRVWSQIDRQRWLEPGLDRAVETLVRQLCPSAAASPASDQPPRVPDGEDRRPLEAAPQETHNN